MFYSKKLNIFKNLKHCFFSRKNGVSKGIYKSLNCGLGSGDKKKNIFKNLEIVKNRLKCKNQSIITLNQIHSNKVVVFEKKNSIKNKLSADAIVTTIKNIPLGILTADCVPILFYDPNKKVVGCAHSGWRGALSGIIKNTIKKFNKLNCKNEDLIVAIGPCIKNENYEVGIELYERFVNQDQSHEECFTKVKINKYIFDLRKFINKELINLNVKKVDNIELDTYSEKENFFSYRRSCINKEKDYGRCISVILMT